MNKIEVKRVTTRKEMNDFVRLPRTIYKGNRCHVPDLDIDIRQTFDRRHNAGLENSEMEAFVAYDDEGHAVGRVAAIVNHAANRKWQVRNVRFGMLEFIDDLRVSKALMDAVAKWGLKRGMDHMQGPMGIFDFDKEGMLVEDFDLVGSMITLYNPPYYPQHMVRLGFEKEADWVQIQLNVPASVPEKYRRVADYCREAGKTTVPIGYTCEVRKFQSSLRPKAGDTLNTSISFGPEVNGVRIIRAKSIRGHRTVATVEMKIYIKPES